MSVKELIREGLMLRDWDLIIRAYKEMGEGFKYAAGAVENLNETLKIYEEAAQQTVNEGDWYIKNGISNPPEKEKVSLAAKPKKKVGRPKKIKVVEQELELEDDDEEVEERPKSGPAPEMHFNASAVKPRKSDAEPHRNAFVDSGRSFAKLTKEDKEFWAQHEPTPREREFELVDVECAKCHKRESVAPVLAPIRFEGTETSRYYCSKCSKGRK